MLNTAKELSTQIQITQKEIEAMNDKIFSIEMEKLQEIIDITMSALDFTPIYQVNNDDEESFFTNEKGDYLKGRLVYFSGDYYRETDGGDVEGSTEVFLLDDGSLKVFHTLTESYYCENCEEFHQESLRNECECQCQSLKGFHLGVIANNIVDSLREKQSYLAEFKNERIAKLQSLT